MGKLDRDVQDAEWTRLCNELKKAKSGHEAAEAAIADSCGAAPRKSGEVADAQDALKEGIEANMRGIEVLRQMRAFISGLD